MRSYTRAVAAAEIPEGTVTVLFTDLVDSTRLNQALGDAAARELTRRVEAAAHRQIEAHRGVPIKDLGDGTGGPGAPLPQTDPDRQFPVVAAGALLPPT